MENIPSIALDAVVIECADVHALADFYCRMLGWQKGYDEGDEWVDICAPSGGIKIAFQKNDMYVPPVWPDEPGAQQQMAHIDFAVQNRQHMALAAAHAISCGAVKAYMQFSEEKWVTLLDPAGHPFCFVIAQ